MNLKRRFLSWLVGNNKGSYSDWYTCEMAWPLIRTSFDSRITVYSDLVEKGTWGSVTLDFNRWRRKFPYSLSGFFHLHPPHASASVSPRDESVIRAWSLSFGRPMFCGIFNGSNFTVWRYFEEVDAVLGFSDVLFPCIFENHFYTLISDLVPGFSSVYPDGKYFLDPVPYSSSSGSV